MQIKNILASRTVWLNIIAFVLLVLALPQLGAVVPASAVSWIALITAVLNEILRVFFTAQPLTQIAAAGAKQG